MKKFEHPWPRVPAPVCVTIYYTITHIEILSIGNNISQSHSDKVRLCPFKSSRIHHQNIIELFYLYISIHKSSLYSLLHEPPVGGSKWVLGREVCQWEGGLPTKVETTNCRGFGSLCLQWMHYKKLERRKTPCWSDHREGLLFTTDASIYYRCTWIEMQLEGATVSIRRPFW